MEEVFDKRYHITLSEKILEPLESCICEDWDILNPVNQNILIGILYIRIVCIALSLIKLESTWLV